MEKKNPRSNKQFKNEIIQGLISNLENPIHIRLLNAYKGENPLDSMEKELGRILTEVISNED